MTVLESDSLLCNGPVLESLHLLSTLILLAGGRSSDAKKSLDCMHGQESTLTLRSYEQTKALEIAVRSLEQAECSKANAAVKLTKLYLTRCSLDQLKIINCPRP